MRFRAFKRSYFALPYGHRVFVATAGVATAFMLFAGVAALGYLSLRIAILNFIGAAGFGLLTYLAFFRRKFAGLYLPFAALTLALLILQQINHAGFDGSVPIIFVAVVVALLSIADATAHRMVLAALLVVVCGLFVLERNIPELIHSYPDEEARRFDIFFALIVSVLSVWAVVGGLRRNFEVEREKLHRANNRLLETARKLRRAQQASETSARARKSFLSTMSHEIRTPLNSIIGLAHLLQSEDGGGTGAAGRLSGDDQASIRTIRFSAEHLLSLINDILDYSRLDSGVVEPEARLIHVEDWLNELIETFRPAAKKNETTLGLRLPEARPRYIRSDSSRLTQILTNLVGNAIKFSGGGSVDLELHTRKLNEINWDVCFEIRDTGVGIPPERLDTIFDEFTQAEAHTYRQFGGTGLGLTIVRRLVELFGGEIRVESLVGKGSRFFVDLALAVGVPEAASIQSTESATGVTRVFDSVAGLGSPEDEAAFLAGRRALIVEDFEMNRIIAERFLKRWGLEVVSAESGGEALALLEQPQSSAEPFDVILMDIQMPGLDGYETTRLIRALGGVNANVPILALTAASLPEEREQAFAAGMDDYVAKPFRPDDLRLALLRNLRRT
ncbi:MAG: ATP-binding protein [Leptospirales bacterium]|jgi:signal transduction histidine kinase/CheY-like chemotaxis protein